VTASEQLSERQAEIRSAATPTLTLELHPALEHAGRWALLRGTGGLERTLLRPCGGIAMDPALSVGGITTSTSSDLSSPFPCCSGPQAGTTC
jgi:hypothetical protein